MIFDFIHTTDLHGRRDIIRQLPAPSDSVILLDSGDAVSGSPFSLNRVEPVLSDMKKAGYSAMAMGNREFSYFPFMIKNRLACAGFPILSANVQFSDSDINLSPFLILDRLGCKIAVIGLSPVQFKSGSLLSKITGCSFASYVEALLAAKNRMPEVDLTVLLSHCGFNEDIELTRSCGFLDIILAGHSHLKFEEPFESNGIPICHTGCYGTSYARISVDSDGGIVDYRHIFPERV